MRIEKLFTYPIKSLRGIELQHGEMTPHGFPHDRSFILLRDYKDASKAPSRVDYRYENMQVSHYPKMCLFTTEFDTSEQGAASPGYIRVTFNDPNDSDRPSILVPIEPDTHNLETIKVVLHCNPCNGYNMPQEYSQFFSDIFGFDIVFVYLGNSYRIVYGNLAPNAHTRNPHRQRQQSSLGSIVKALSSYVPILNFGSDRKEEKEYKITFADVSPYLVISQTSVNDISGRLPGSLEMDATKFRPNIILSGAEEPFEEDYWKSLSIHHNGSVLNLSVTANCIRCRSLNVDYNTGDYALGPAGEILKLLQKDRRVDTVLKGAPCFGRYAYFSIPDQQCVDGFEVCVGDSVRVTGLSDARTGLKWPGFGPIKSDDRYPL